MSQGGNHNLAYEIEGLVFAFDAKDSRRARIRELAAGVRALAGFAEWMAREECFKVADGGRAGDICDYANCVSCRALEALRAGAPR